MFIFSSYLLLHLYILALVFLFQLFNKQESIYDVFQLIEEAVDIDCHQRMKKVIDEN
jgi:hypothetical protein